MIFMISKIYEYVLLLMRPEKRGLQAAYARLRLVPSIHGWRGMMAESG